MPDGRSAEETRGVLVAGAINTDLVARVQTAPGAGETVIGHDFAIFGGGKAANQAVAVARSQARIAMLGAVGDDDFGRQRLADLSAEGIDVRDVAVVTGEPSGVALITVEERSAQNRIANVLGATTTVTPEQATRAVERTRPAVVLTTLELPPPTLLALVAAAKQTGATVILNAAPSAAVGRELIAKIDVLIVNETEAGDLLGHPVVAGAGAETALALSDLGPPAVVVTLGAEGAVIAHAGETTTLAAPAVEVRDTTGAGDAFCGAMAARLATGDSLVLSAQAGVSAGSLATTRAGAQPSMPTREEIARLTAAQSPA